MKKVANLFEFSLKNVGTQEATDTEFLVSDFDTDIVEAILAGRQPLKLNASRLKRSMDLPLSWPEQRKLLGISNEKLPDIQRPTTKTVTSKIASGDESGRAANMV